MACEEIQDAHKMLYIYEYSFWFIMTIIMVLYTLWIYASVKVIYDGINSFSAISLISKKKTNINTLYVKAVEKDGDGGAQTQNNTRRVEQAKILLPNDEEYAEGDYIVSVENVFDYYGELRVDYSVQRKGSDSKPYRHTTTFDQFADRFITKEEEETKTNLKRQLQEIQDREPVAKSFATFAEYYKVRKAWYVEYLTAVEKLENMMP